MGKSRTPWLAAANTGRASGVQPDAIGLAWLRFTLAYRIRVEIFLHSNERLKCRPDAFEDYVGSYFGEGGRVRGGSFDTPGWNLDVEVFGDRSETKLRAFAAFLKRFGVPSDTTLRYVLSDGSQHTIVVHECQA